MDGRDPLELEVDLGEPAIETESLVASGASQRRPLLALVVAVLLGLIGWQFMTGGGATVEGEIRENGETNGGEPDNGDAGVNDEGLAVDPPIELDRPNIGDAEVGASPPIPGPEYSVAEDLPEVPGADGLGGSEGEAPSDSVPTFPLFPDRPGLTLAFANPDGEVLLLNADDGTMSVMPASELAPGTGGSSSVSHIERIDDTLVVQEMSGYFGYPLDGGVKVDYGHADDLVVTPDLVVMLDYPDAPGELLSLRGFLPDGRGDFDWVEAPRNDVWLNDTGVISAPDGTYIFNGSGFERISAHQVSAMGENHRLEVRCDAVLDCTDHRVDLISGRAETVNAPYSQWWGGQGLSPDGQWLNFTDWSGGLGGRPELVVADLRTGEQTRLAYASENEDGPALPVWDSSSRYSAVASDNGSSLSVFDATANSVRIVGADELGLAFRLGSFVFLDPGEV